MTDIHEALADLERRICIRERDMAMAQGESPREPDYSEGHYTGWRKGLLEAANMLAECRREVAS